MAKDCNPRQSRPSRNHAEELIFSQMTQTIRVALKKGNRDEAYRAVDRAAASLSEQITVAPDDHVSALGFDRRTCTILENAGIEEVRQLEALTMQELLEVYQVGPDLARTIARGMESFGKHLRPTPVSVLGLGELTREVLAGSGITELRRLKALTSAELRSLHGMTEPMWREIIAAMRDFGTRPRAVQPIKKAA